MTTFALSRNFAAALALAGSLAIAAVQPAAADATATIDQHGPWASVVNHADNRPVCGVRTEMRDGGELRLMIIDGGVHLVAHDPNWDMRSNQESHVSIAVDGETFTGTAEAIDGQTLMMVDLSTDFVRDFVAGSDMEANFGGVRWSVDLTGSYRATSDMVTCAAAARRSMMM